MTDRVLLTEKREQLLEGDYDSGDATHRNRKSRLKQSSEVTLDELIRVAECPIIDNTDIFEPGDVARLISALLTPDHSQYSGGGLIGPEVDEDDPASVDLSDEFRQYRDRLYVVLDEPMHVYRDNRFPDPGE